jgi:hypothetical protein
MSKHVPLWQRLNTIPAYIAVARLVGYPGMPEMPFWERYHALCQEHGQPSVQAAVEALVTFDKQHTPPFVRLNVQARRLCWQLLGPPPEKWDGFYRHANGEPDDLHAAKMAQLQPPPAAPKEPGPPPEQAAPVNPSTVAVSPPAARPAPAAKQPRPHQEQPIDLRDLSALERTASWLDELLQACRPRGPLHHRHPKFVADVTRKAKALHTALANLCQSLDQPKEKP